MNARVSILGLGIGVLGLAACKQEAPAPVVRPLEVEQAKVEPKDEVPAVDPDAFRATRPEAAPIKPLEVPELQSFTLANGLKVNLVRYEALPTVALSLEFYSAGFADPDKKIGLHDVCWDLLSEGTKRLDKIAWAEALADQAVQIYSSTGLERSSLELRALSTDLGPALKLFAEVMMTPRMDAGDFKRIIQERKANLKQARGTASGIAGRLLRPLLWGEGHPFGRIRTEAHLDAIKVADCVAMAKGLGPDGATLWVAGKVDADTLKTELETAFGAWKGKAPSKPNLARAQPAEPALYLVQVDGAVQTEVRLLHVGPERTDPAYAANELLVETFASGFTSRLNMNLREKNGFSYGGSGFVNYLSAGGEYLFRSSVESSTTALTVAEIAKEYALMRESGVTEEEFLRDRAGALLTLPAKVATPSEGLATFQSLARFGYAPDWIESYAETLKGLTVEAVNAARSHLLQPEKGVLLLVGDFTKEARNGEGKTIREALEASTTADSAGAKALGYERIIFLSPDGKRL